MQSSSRGINKVRIYREAQCIYFTSINIEMQKVALYDLRGSLLPVLEDVNGKTDTFSKLNIANQVVLVKITTIDPKVTSRKIAF